MNRNFFSSPFFIIVVALAGFGFIFRLIVDPKSIITQIFMIALTLAIIFGIYKLISNRRMSANQSGYQKALKQSKNKYQKPTNNSPFFNASKTNQAVTKTKKPLRPLSSKRNKDHHLTVIEGNKGKKKNRASF